MNDNSMEGEKRGRENEREKSFRKKPERWYNRNIYRR